MNEIDFSLEQIDFALRRRFLWYFYGFNETILKDIIEHKCNDEDTKVKIRPDDVERFVNNAKKLNEEISKVSELGKQYQIGHTFFGEIVDIYKSYKETESKKSHQIYRANKTGPVAILWNISLQPMLEAFLGNIPPKSVERVVDILKTVYFTKKVE